MSTLNHCAIPFVVFLHIYAFLTFPDPTEGIIGLLNLSFKYIAYKKTPRLRSVKYGNSPRFLISDFYFHIFTTIISQFKQYQSPENLAIHRYEIKTNKTETRSVVIFSRPKLKKEGTGKIKRSFTAVFHAGVATLKINALNIYSTKL